MAYGIKVKYTRSGKRFATVSFEKRDCDIKLNCEETAYAMERIHREMTKITIKAKRQGVCVIIKPIQIKSNKNKWEMSAFFKQWCDLNAFEEEVINSYPIRQN